MPYYHCKACNNKLEWESETILGYCTQCNEPWEPIEPEEAGPAASELDLPSTATEALAEQALQAEENAAHMTSSFEHYAPGASSAYQSSPRSYPDSQPGIPLTLEVKLQPVRADARQLPVEFRIRAKANQRIRGQVRLSDTMDNDGEPQFFDMARQVQGAISLSFVDEIQELVAIRIRLTGQETELGRLPEEFMQGNIILQRAADGLIHAHVDNSQSGDGPNVGGINDVKIIYNQSVDKPIWQSVELVWRGPKYLSMSHHQWGKDFDGNVRKIALEDPDHGKPEVPTSRITLRRYSGTSTDAAHSQQADRREHFVELFAGPRLNIGRAQTWYSKDHAHDLPNDLVLRALKTDDEDLYISRYQGYFEFAQNDSHFVNLSSGGTIANEQHVLKRGEPFRLPEETLLRTGAKLPKGREKALSLKVRRTFANHDRGDYELFARDSHLNSGPSQSDSMYSLSMSRTDALAEHEETVFFAATTTVGSDPLSAAWCINHPSVRPLHAILLWCDNSFWIEPASRGAFIEVEDTILLRHRLARLNPGSNLRIGDVRFNVLPQWRQHVLNCHCCDGHEPRPIPTLVPK